MSINIKIFFTLFLSVFVTTVGVGIVTPLLPVYAHELGAGAFQIGLIFAAFSLTRSIFVPYFGKLSDRKGKKVFLVMGLFTYFLVSILFIFSNSIEILILLRLGQGFASAMILPVAQAYIGMITPENKEGLIMGLFNISIYGGLSAGPLLGGIVKDWFSIYFSFMCMSFLTLSGFFLCLIFLPAEEKSNLYRQNSNKSISYIKLISNPLIFSLFTFRTCFTTCIGIIWTFLPVLASVKLGLSSTAIGFIVMINVFLAGFLQAPMGYLADRFSKKILTLTGGILATMAILYMNIASTFFELIIANAFIGLAGGISLPAIMALGVIEGRKLRAMGSLMGLLALAHSLGMLAGPLLAGISISLFSFETMFFLGATVLIIGTIVFSLCQQENKALK
ncbi:MAG TPA: MFS transporter [Desulfobacteraceae bacterium]|nr:MFS transporter [Desulfobacteraceae bacterium]HPJ67104.1 MFS transporter [Desulfobacteraceae bacterium]HPQ29676.1 MFS transporter [Desulfobacteraceae bacterium]